MGRVDGQLLDSLERDLDCFWIGSRRNYEIEFELPPIAVEDQIDSRIKALVSDTAITTNLGVPLSRVSSDEVITNSWQEIGASNSRIRIATNEFQPNRFGLVR